MPMPNLSSKRLQISKANSMIVIVVSIAAAVTAFSLVSTRALANQRSYQSRVIAEQKKAKVVADQNVKAVEGLKASYDTFNIADPNIIGGKSSGTDEKDGDNTKLVLDALPSQYDFPALISSLEKVLKNPRYDLEALSGSDAGEAMDSAAAGGSAVDMPFQFSIRSSYKSSIDLINSLDQVIRPISISQMQISGDESNVTLNVSAKTYWQPGRALTVNSKVVK